jgi:hypothetical protein
MEAMLAWPFQAGLNSAGLGVSPAEAFRRW